MLTIHCISGLGADQRVFAKLKIQDAVLQAVPWVDIDKHDDMACYAQKMAAQIPEGDEHIILGLSFGGMLASEIARTRPTQKVIIVSSAKMPAEVEMPGKFLQFIVHKGLLPIGIAPMASKQIAERFGAESQEDNGLIRTILEETDPHFARCAFRAIIDWQSRTPPPKSLVQIHGTADRIIPPDRIQPTHGVQGGGHIMIYNRAEELSTLIAQHLT